MTVRSARLRTLFQYVPALDSLRGYSLQHARGDLAGGLSVAAVAVPQAMAYAMVAGLPAEYGLYTAIVMTAVGALFDSSRQLINGPTNAISIAVLSAIGAVADRADGRRPRCCMAFLVGAIQLGITLLRLGDLTRYISHSVIVGFTAGAGMLLVLDQLKNLLGRARSATCTTTSSCASGARSPRAAPVHGPTLRSGSASIALVLALRWLKRRLGWPLFPEFLLVVVAMAAVTAALGLDRAACGWSGEIPAKLPAFRAAALRLRSGCATRHERARDRGARAARGDRDGEGDRGGDPPEARHEPAVPVRGPRELRRAASSSACRARARSRARRSTSRRARDAVVGRDLGGRRSALIMLVVRALRALHPARRARRHPDGDGREMVDLQRLPTTCARRASTPRSSP